MITFKADAPIILTYDSSRTPAGRRRVAARDSRGIMPPHRSDEYLKRRGSAKQGINVFDLSRLVSGGVESDLNFYDLMTFTDSSTASFDTDPIDSSTYALLKAAILPDGAAVAAVKTTHRAIKKIEAVVYGLAMYSEADVLYDPTDPALEGRFGSKGIVLPHPADLVSVSTNNGEQVYLLDPAVKITTSFDSSASGVSFTFNGAEDIFLMPAVAAFTGRAIDSELSLSPDPSVIWYLNNLFGVVGFNLLIELGSYVVNEWANTAGSSNTELEYQEFWRKLHIITDHYDVRAGKSTFAGGGYPSWSSISTGDFGFPRFPDPSPRPVITEGYQELFYINTQYATLSPAVPRLLAVIFQGGSKFYVWQT